MFFRLNTDGTRQDLALEGMFCGAGGSACWLVGGGPALKECDWRAIAASPIPKMGINLAGSGLFRPNFWTAYDPSARFHRSVYLDPGIMKFVHRRRGMDLVPETTFKVCDCPNIVFFEGDRQRGFADFVSLQHRGVVDWADTMVQGIDLLFHLGFRRVYLAGCEMRVSPSERQRELARERGVEWTERSRLADFLTECEKKGLSGRALDDAGEVSPYHFEERKTIRGAANTDSHYFRVAQYLRLSRRGMALAGLELISVTPRSRLNDYFRVMDVATAVEEIHRRVGNPEEEETLGRYRQKGARTAVEWGPMRDFRPLNWPEGSRGSRERASPEKLEGEDLIVEAEGFVKEEMRGELERMIEGRGDVPEVG